LYQNIFFQKGKNKVHLWDDLTGYHVMDFKPYAYERNPFGESTTLSGVTVSKTYEFTKDDPNLFEADVPETTRILVDLYHTSDIPSVGHVIMTFDIEVEMITGLPDTQKAKNAITAIALHDSATDVYYALVLDEFGKVKNTTTGNRVVKSYSSERELLRAFLTIYEEIRPSIITGWNIDSFDVPYLFNRITNVLGRTSATRLSPIGECFYSPYRNRWSFAGVSALDYIHLYKTYNYGLEASYTLNHIATKELGKGKLEYKGNLDDLFREDINKYIDYNIVDVELVVGLEKKLQFIELCRAICHAGHVPYEDFVYSSKYLEGACLNYLKHRNLVAPNKPADRRERMQEINDNNQEKFIGAYVKEPIVGKYDWIYDLDLTSLYPSIIMTLNISPETKVGKIENWDAEDWIKGIDKTYDVTSEGSTETYTKGQVQEMIKEHGLGVAANGVLYDQSKPGLIADILDTWFKQRVEFRKLESQYGAAGDTEKYEFYAKRQLVQKILLNSMYGVLGLPAFRFYDIDNAEAVTITGQTVIKKTAEMANIKYQKELGTKEDYNVYIDTDSIYMLAEPLVKHRFPEYKGFDEKQMASVVNDIAEETQLFLNKFYDILAERFFFISKDKHRFEIKKEYISKAGFWVAKKRYAQWMILKNGIPCDKLDVKGLDVVRSSFPKAFQDFMSGILRDILTGKTNEDVDKELREFKLSLSGLDVSVIAKGGAVKEISKYDTKTLDKRIGAFEKGTPAHVKAAITYNRLLKHYNCPFMYEPIRDGDKVKWVYLKQNPFGLDTVAFKNYNDPDVIMDFVKQYIDVDRIFEAELENKMDDFYKALKWEKVNHAQKKLSQFFGF
jgi:DNA polymerase elongation subunit (family B)